MVEGLLRFVGSDRGELALPEERNHERKHEPDLEAPAQEIAGKTKIGRRLHAHRGDQTQSQKQVGSVGG